ncbi:MAG: HD-GYP domain-containing protein [Gammaproteobacteria bacterium]
MKRDDPVYHALFRYTQALSVALGYRDHFTRLHSQRVRDLSEELGKRCGLCEDELAIVKIGASFHDIGKIGIPDQILRKSSAFEAYEKEQMRKHSEIGADIMLATEVEGADLAARVIRHHHEYFNGQGYPDGLAGEAIPIGARIISITDSYDAMSEMRPYHAPKKHAEIMDLLHGESGQKHDPELMRLFTEIIANSQFRTA